MKKRAFFIIAFIHFAALYSCSENGRKETKVIEAEEYQCPMKCTNEMFSKPGECPVCKMTLEKVSNS